MKALGKALAVEFFPGFFVYNVSGILLESHLFQVVNIVVSHLIIKRGALGILYD